MVLNSSTRRNYKVQFTRVISASLLYACLINLDMLHAAPLDESDDSGWHELELIDQSLRVNEGELTFIDPIANFNKHQVTNKYTITATSLDDGWVNLAQCHSDLDAVSESQIMYRYNGLKNLQITSKANIERAWVEKNTVQLQNVLENSTICIQAQVQILRKYENGIYAMRSGPFYRRFLDGFYPMNVQWNLEWQSVPIKVAGLLPKSDKGLFIQQAKNSLTLNAWFEGKLTFVIAFEKIDEK